MPLGVTLLADRWGWAHLHLMQRGESGQLTLTYTDCGFDGVMAWTDAVAAGHLPLRVSCDEEGRVGHLDAHLVPGHDLLCIELHREWWDRTTLEFRGFVAPRIFPGLVRDAYRRSLTDPQQFQGWQEYLCDMEDRALDDPPDPRMERLGRWAG